MRRRTWLAVGTVAIAIAAVGFGRPHRVTAAPQPPLPSEAEIRSLDIAFYERRIAEDPLSAADRSRLAGLYLQRARETGSYSDYERTEVLARESLRLRESRNEATWVLLTSALMAKHDFAAALRAARHLYQSDTGSASHTALLAEVELEVGDYESAGRHFGRVVGSADTPSIAARLARWYEVTGHLAKGTSILRQSLAQLARSSDVPREQVAWFHYRLGELYLRSGAYAAADSSFHSALEVLPADYRAFGGLARLAASRKAWAAAIEFGSRSIAVQLDPATLGTMSDAYGAIGDSAQATSFADAMQTAALSQPGAIHRAWGLFLLDHGRDVARVLAAARTDVAVRRDVYGYDLLAWASFKAGRLEEARNAADKALSQHTEDASVLYHAGMIAVAAGDSVHGRSLLRRALSLNATFSPTQSRIARAQLEALGGGWPPPASDSAAGSSRGAGRVRPTRGGPRV